MPASGFTITVDMGGTEKLGPWAKQLQKQVVAAMQQSFTKALPAVKQRERVKTGNMRNSTTAGSSGQGAEIIAEAGYSGYQNYGTRYMSGTHFMEAGVSAIVSDLPAAMANAIKII